MFSQTRAEVYTGYSTQFLQKPSEVSASTGFILQMSNQRLESVTCPGGRGGIWIQVFTVKRHPLITNQFCVPMISPEELK